MIRQVADLPVTEDPIIPEGKPMPRPVTNTLAVALATVVLLAAGCVRQDMHDDVLTVNKSLDEQLYGSTQTLEAVQSELAARDRQLSQANTTIASLESEYGAIDDEINRLLGRNDVLMRRIAELHVGPLPGGILTALQDMATTWPDRIDFDATTGTMRFASDFTFSSGHATLRDDAVETLAALSEIITSDAATGFEVRIVGHTDNVPVRYSRAQHPSNLHLSVHRAIAVRDAMIEHGVDPTRVQVAGYGEYRPIADNEDDGTAANRRVEIYFVPMPELVTDWDTTTEGAPSEVAEATSDEPMK